MKIPILPSSDELSNTSYQYLNRLLCLNSSIRYKTLNDAIAILLRSYTRSMQSQENFTGSLFQQKTKANELIDADNATINYISLCAHYIHFNPLKAKILENLEEWNALRMTGTI